ncbi:MAG: hypothetical protein M3463_06285, partial [Verrucomicrobiota bacterium]|nr:hypothetical protein [Verrucomicrobiota bacterium]
PNFTQAHARAGLKSIRYPGGTVGNTFEWKKAIGPIGARAPIQPFSGGGTPTGVFGKPAPATFGVDEAARWCGENGVEMIYMFGIAFGTPQDAADLVEYLNAPIGQNHNGGTDWAAVRAQNGHPAPYGVRYFEIANEADGPSQRYWWPFIDSDQTRAKKKLPFQQERDSYAPEFLFGGMAKFEKQGVGTRDERGATDFRDDQSNGDGTPNQRKVIRYRPVEPGSEQVFVGDEPYTRVPDISQATGKAYQIDSATGVITFGDGQRTTVPPPGAAITASYRSRRHGFVDCYNAMKAVDPGIKIYAGYESPNIVTTLGDKHPYDGVVIHPYTNQYNVPKAADLNDWHHNLMLSGARLGHEVGEYQELIDKTVAPARRGQVHVICTEFGAIVQDQVLPQEARGPYWRNLNIGLYTGQQLLHYMRAGVPQAHRHATTVGVFGPSPEFEYTPTAMVYETFTRHFGDRLIRLEMQNVPQRDTGRALIPGHGSPGKIIRADAANRPATAVNVTLPKWDAEASRDAQGNVYILVINQDATDDATVNLQVAGVTKGEVEVRTLNGPSLTATSDNVRVQTTRAAFVDGMLRHAFPAHSLTTIKVPASR